MKISNHIIAFITFIVIQRYHGTLTPLVHIAQGKLRGVRASGYDRYLSIPYATSERFQVSINYVSTFKFNLGIAYNYNGVML